jgi:hypothetical protein
VKPSGRGRPRWGPGAKERLISIAAETLRPAVREHPGREATEYQGSPVALQGYRENREAAQERFERCHLVVPISSRALRALKQVLHARCVPLSTTRRWDAACIQCLGNLTQRARTGLLGLTDNGQDVRREPIGLGNHGLHRAPAGHREPWVAKGHPACLCSRERGNQGLRLLVAHPFG